MFFLIASPSLSQQNKHGPDSSNREINFTVRVCFFRGTTGGKNLSLSWSRNADVEDFLVCASLPRSFPSPSPYLQGDLIYEHPVIPVLWLPFLVF